MSGESYLSNNDVAASEARRVPDHRLRDHDPDKKLNVEGALVCRVASRDCPWCGAGSVMRGKRPARESVRGMGEEDDGGSGRQ